MTNIINISLDLETWGTDPGRDIRSIGACVTDPAAGTVGIEGLRPHNVTGVFYQNVENPSLPYDEAFTEIPDGTFEFAQNADYPHADPVLQRCFKYPLTRDPSTVEWWSHPDRADAAAQLLTNVVDLRDGLIAFGHWIAAMCPDGVFDAQRDHNFRIWCHGENMDEPMLRMAYKACGLPVPWHYRSPRDTRTIFDAAGMDPATCLTAFQTGGTHHNALDDATTQARAICAAHATIAGWRTQRDALMTAARPIRDTWSEGDEIPAAQMIALSVAIGDTYEPTDAERDDPARMSPSRDIATLTLKIDSVLAVEQIEAITDIGTHAGDFRKALENMRDTSEPAGVDHDDPGYWQHQLDVLDRIVKAFAEPG